MSKYFKSMNPAYQERRGFQAKETSGKAQRQQYAGNVPETRGWSLIITREKILSEIRWC